MSTLRKKDKQGELRNGKREISLSTPTKQTYTIQDVRVVQTYYIAVPISKIETMQMMRFLSYILTLVGGVVAGIVYPSEYLFLGIAMIIIGLIIEYLKVHKVMHEWVTSELRGTITGSTITDTSEYEKASYM